MAHSRSLPRIRACGVVLDLKGRPIWISERHRRRVCAPSDLWERPGVRRASSEYGRARHERRRLPHRSFFKASEWEISILFDSLLTTFAPAVLINNLEHFNYWSLISASTKHIDLSFSQHLGGSTPQRAIISAPQRARL